LTIESTRRGPTVPALAGMVLANPLAPLALVVALGIFGMLVQLSRPLGHDVGWLLIVTDRLLAGADVYGRDVFEWNAPANLYILTPSVAIGRLFGVSLVTTARVEVALLAAGCLLLCGAVLRGLLGRDRALESGTVLAALAFALFVFVDEAFGQREHLVAMLALPQALVVAARLDCHRRNGLERANGHDQPEGHGRSDGRAADDVGRRVAVLAGIAAATAICIKPQYALIWLVWEVALATRTRTLRVWRRPDWLAASAVGVVYLVSIWLVTPGWLTTMLPLALDSYWVYQSSFGSVVQARDLALLGLTLCVFPVVRGRPELVACAAVLWLTGAGFYLISVLHQTGWRYHVLPFQVCMIVLVSLALARGVGAFAQRLPEPSTALRITCAVVVGSVALSAFLVTPNRYSDVVRAGAAWRAGGTAGPIGRLERFLRQHAGDGSVYVVNLSMAGLFPAFNHAGVEWSSRFPVLHLPVAIVRQRAGGEGVPARLTDGRVAEIEAYLRDAVIEDLRRRPADLILIEHLPRRRFFAGARFDFLEFLLEDARFAEIWSGYEAIAGVGRFDAWRAIE